jgi:hypothetical protein
MGPEYVDTGSFEVAWSTGLFAATATAILELSAIPMVFALRSFIPRAALRSSVAGVAFTAVNWSAREGGVMSIRVRAS